MAMFGRGERLTGFFLSIRLLTGQNLPPLQGLEVIAELRKETQWPLLFPTLDRQYKLSGLPSLHISRQL
jgi:hypothetical protein